MPRIKHNGKRVKNVRIEKAWIEILVKDDDIPNALESYLVQTRVADYIEKLEAKIKELPKLPKK